MNHSTGMKSWSGSSSGGVKRTSSGEIKKPPVDSAGWCYTRCKEDISYSFAWTIEGFRRKMETFTNGQCLTSHIFKVTVDGKETAWKLECFPNGKQKNGEDTVGAVSVFLYPMNSNAINRNFSFAIGFVNEDLSRVMKGKGEHCFRDNQNGWGWLKLVTHQTLKGEGRESRPEGEKLLPNDCLNILCVMKFKGEDHTTSGSSKPAVISTSSDEIETLDVDSSGLLNLLETGELTDIEVTCGTETFRCHSVVLAAKSNVFRAMLVNDMREKATKKINLENIEPDIFKAILMYMYGGEIINFDDQDKASRILKAADQYELLDLKRRCEKNLCSHLTIKNCLEHLIIAEMHNVTRLKQLAIKFVVENAQEVTFLPSWQEKLTCCPEIFTEVFRELANQKSGKRYRSSDEVGWSQIRQIETDLEFKPVHS
eukprot:TRINITY_DN12594_c0_g1_i1.p1 TRINITY_DN12594_c0_g1~~TRINITY_DN12594_c0_g1_i1.p1  ORF type:complete len:426 (-),score=56.56 TRINITY_DN12594_c0_g1_i1:105-1382(-)